MRMVARVCLLLSLALTVAVPMLAAQDKKPASEAAKKPTPQVFTFPKEIVLTEDQQAKLKAIQAEFGDKLADLQKKQSDVLTPEQKKARTATVKANREAKKTNKEGQAALLAALNLTDEQKPKWDAASAELNALRKQIETKKTAMLTEEQKAKLPTKKGNAKG